MRRESSAAVFSLVLVVSLCCCSLAAEGGAGPSKPAYEWQHTDNSVALLNHKRIVWRLNFDKKLSRPYFHPVCLTDGTALTWDSPPDHIWHHGLWFSWKLINGVNYWEEDPKTGLSAGRTEFVGMKTEPNDDYSAAITMTLNYHPADKPVVLSEKRVLKVSRPDEQGRYRIDWHSRFTAVKEDVTFDRTPIPDEPQGQSWGGYAGLSVRIAKDIRDWQVIDSEGRKGTKAHGQKAQWMDFSGSAFGGSTGKRGGIAIFDHPDNPRHPSPWYVSMDPNTPFGYFSPAFLFDRSYRLRAGRSLELRYVVLIHPGGADKGYLEEQWKKLKASATRVGDTKTVRAKRVYVSIDRLLETKVDVSHWTRETAFGDAIEDLKNSVRPPLRLVVLWRDLYERADIDKQTPIYMDGVADVPLGTALSLLLMAVAPGPDELGYVIDGGVITVATKDSLRRQWKTRVYDISDLL